MEEKQTHFVLISIVAIVAVVGIVSMIVATTDERMSVSGDDQNRFGRAISKITPDEGGWCGDDIKQDGEQCDGSDFGTIGIKCVSYSSAYESGILKCSQYCTIDTSGCVKVPQGSLTPAPYIYFTKNVPGNIEVTISRSGRPLYVNAEELYINDVLFKRSGAGWSFYTATTENLPGFALQKGKTYSFKVRYGFEDGSFGAFSNILTTTAS